MTTSLQVGLSFKTGCSSEKIAYEFRYTCDHRFIRV